MIIKRKGALGDVVLLTPVIRQLRLDNPNIYIGVETLFPDVFKNSPYVNKAAKKINKKDDNIIELNAYYEKNLDQHPIDVYANVILGHNNLLSKTVELFTNEKDRTFIDKLWEKSIPKDSKIAVVHLGTTWVPIKGDEFDKFLKVLTKEYVVILVGKKIPSIEYYPKHFDNVVNFIDKEFSIHRLHWLIQKADLFFGTDTGVMHIAATTNTPIVCCYSFVNPIYRMPFRECIDFRPVVPKEDACDNPFCAENNKKLCPNGDFGGVKCTKFSCAKSITSNMMIGEVRSIGMPFKENIK